MAHRSRASYLLLVTFIFGLLSLRAEAQLVPGGPQITIALFADAAELVFAPARVLLRHEPDPGREIPSRSKCLGITNARDQSSRKCRADTRDGVKSLARLIRSVPSHDATIEGEDLGFQGQQLSVKQLCCSGVLVGTKRMFGLVTASQIASASAASFFCRLT